jgi:hypothetical protein
MSSIKKSKVLQDITCGVSKTYWKWTEKKKEHRRNTNSRNSDYSKMTEMCIWYLNELNMHDCNSGIFRTITKLNTHCL